MKIKLSQVEAIFNHLVEASKTSKVPGLQFDIKHFKRGDFN